MLQILWKYNIYILPFEVTVKELRSFFFFFANVIIPHNILIHHLFGGMFWQFWVMLPLCKHTSSLLGTQNSCQICGCRNWVNFLVTVRELQIHNTNKPEMNTFCRITDPSNAKYEEPKILTPSRYLSSVVMVHLSVLRSLPGTVQRC